jgi:glycosyltransferase involved in cell wall biosynthesis
MENKKFNQENKSLISIVLTNYNRENFILEQLDSIVSQTYQNWELIIADDCSTDGSKEIIRRFIENSKDKKIVFFENEENIGVAKNFERGLRYATGEYVAVCDADDVWLSDKLEKELQFLRKGNYGMVYSDLTVVDENLRVIRKSFMRTGLSFFCHRKDESFFELIDNNHISGPTIFFRAEMKNRLVPFSKHAIQDHWIAIIFSIFSTIGYLDVSTVLYRQHSGNMVSAKPLSPISLFLRRDKILLDSHLNMKKNLLLFLNDLSNVEGINSRIMKEIDKKIKKTKLLVDCLLEIKEDKKNSWKRIVELWRNGAFREIIQVIYFKIF